MSDLDQVKIHSRPYRPNPEMACLACTWGHFNRVGGIEVEVNEHSDWCPVGKRITEEMRVAIGPTLWGTTQLSPMEFYEVKHEPEMACPACVWGRGEHSEFCKRLVKWGNPFRYPGFCMTAGIRSGAMTVVEADPEMPPNKILLRWRDRKGEVHSRVIENVGPGGMVEMPTDVDMKTVTIEDAEVHRRVNEGLASIPTMAVKPFSNEFSHMARGAGTSITCECVSPETPNPYCLIHKGSGTDLDRLKTLFASVGVKYWEHQCGRMIAPDTVVEFRFLSVPYGERNSATTPWTHDFHFDLSGKFSGHGVWE